MDHFIAEFAKLGQCIIEVAYENNWINFGPIHSTAPTSRLSGEKTSPSNTNL